MSKNFAHLTAHPKLYEPTYWGAFSKEPNEAIIERRNSFVTLYDLAAYCNAIAPLELMAEAWFDHREAYRTRSGGVVCLASPYREVDHKCPVWVPRFFQPIAPLYHPKAHSYVASFKNLQQVRDAIKVAAAIARLTERVKTEHVRIVRTS